MFPSNRRFVPRLLPTAAIAVTAALFAATAPGQVTVQRGLTRVAGAGGQSTGYYLPGYWQLSQASTAKEIELTGDQKQELKDISDGLREQQRDLYKPLQNPDISQDKRQALMRELREKATEIQQSAAAKVKDVLLPHQLMWLEEIEQRQRILTLIQYDAYLQRLDLSEKQLEELQKSRERLQEKVRKAQQEMYEDALKVLAPEQLEKLEEPYRRAAGR